MGKQEQEAQAQAQAQAVQEVNDTIVALNTALEDVKNDTGRASYSVRYTSTSASISLTKNAILVLQSLGVNIPLNKRYISKTTTPRLYQALEDVLVTYSDKFVCRETTV